MFFPNVQFLSRGNRTCKNKEFEAVDAEISVSASTCATRLACRARSSSSFVFGEFETDRRIFNSELMISVSKRTLSLRQNSRRIQQLKLKTCACSSAEPKWLHGDVSMCDDILARSFLGFDRNSNLPREARELIQAKARADNRFFHKSTRNQEMPNTTTTSSRK